MSTAVQPPHSEGPKTARSAPDPTTQTSNNRQTARHRHLSGPSRITKYKDRVVAYKRRERSQSAICAILDQQLAGTPSIPSIAAVTTRPSCQQIPANSPSLTLAMQDAATTQTPMALGNPPLWDSSPATAMCNSSHHDDLLAEVAGCASFCATTVVPTTGDGATVQAENVHTLIHNRDVDGHTGPRNTNNGNAVSASATDEIPAKDTTQASFPNSTPLPANAADTTGMQKEYPDEVADRRSTSPSPNTDSHENICAHPTNTSLTPYLIGDDVPSNCQATGDDLPISATPKIEPDVEVARFLRIIADQPSYFNVYDSYQNMENTKDTDRERKWISLKTPLCLDMTGHAIYRSYGAGKIMKNNGMKVAVHVLTTKDNKLYPNRKPRWRSIIGPCFAVSLIKHFS
ncbi:uncharacterized protein [Aegilops tauschii subsp. strangulata]|uniref:uncharacterized protein isoform X2 n=1 Tax=Aegilops tauschii subsp. strangulata TaxID=200361 RepID=UPI003CC8801F